MKSDDQQSIDDSNDGNEVEQISFGRRVLRSLTDVWNCVPNRMIGMFVVVATIVELVMISHVKHPLMMMGFKVATVSVLFTLWFWLTVGIVLNRACKKFVTMRDKRTGFKRFALNAAFVTTLVVSAMLYVVSWGMFLETSRFASWEILRFSFANSHDLWLYLVEAEPVHLLHGAVIFSGLSAVVYFLIKPVSRVHHEKADRPIFFNPLWILLLLLLLLFGREVNQDWNFRRRAANVASISNSLNPAMTLCSSALNAFSREQILPLLDESELEPLDTPWSPIPGNAEAIAANESGSDNQLRTVSIKKERSAAPTKKMPSIIMIQVESLRPDVIHQRHQGREIMPNVNRLAEKGLEWTNAYSQATHSDYADPCIVSSLYALRTREHHYYSLNDPWPKQLSYDCLKKVGYTTATISSQNEMWGRMENFLVSPNLDVFYHPERVPDAEFAEASPLDPAFYRQVASGTLKVGKFPDSHTAGVAVDWIESQSKTDKPFLLNMNLQSSHFPYAMADSVPRPFQPCEMSSDMQFVYYEKKHVENVRNAYYNSLYEIDRNIGRIVDKLEELELLDDVIIVVSGENGEAFHENHICSHAQKPYEPSIHIASVMYGPKWFAPAVEDYPMEHVDLLPTIFRKIGLQPHPNFQGIDALSKDRPDVDERFLFCHVNSPASHSDTVQYASRWKYIWDHDVQLGELYDIRNDTGEENDLTESMPELANALHDHLFNWRNRQLAWYHYPAFYSNYYPPKQPKMPADDLELIKKYLDE